MQTISLRAWIVMALIALCLVIAGHLLVLQAKPHGPTTYLDLRGDAWKYFSMAEGRIATVPEPFRYRIAVPFLARLTMLPTPDAFRLISYASLFATYLLALWLCVRLGYGGMASFAGLFAVFASPWQTHNFFNPYITDAPGMLSLFVMVAALIMNAFPAFALAAVLGILTRESALFLVPAWFVTKQWRWATLALILAGAAYMVPRLLLAPETASGGLGYAAQAFRDINLLAHPLDFVKYALATWGFLWFATVLGMALLPSRTFAKVVTAFVLLLAGAVISCFFASGLGRMFAILSPVVAIACTQLYQALSIRSRTMAVIFLLLLVMQFFIGIPTVITPLDSWFFTSSLSRYALFGIGGCWCLVVGVMLRQALRAAFHARKTEGRSNTREEQTATV